MSEPSSLSEPEKVSSKVKKRIIVCCDGTWQNGIESLKMSECTNVLKLARIINKQDEGQNPPIPQVVFYQSGIGSARDFYSHWIDGATGLSLFQKFHKAYAFIAHNYQEGDELFLFGFSRGAYTARMTAHFIGEIGILDKQDLEHFPEIFKAYQIKNSNRHTDAEKKDANKTWAANKSQIDEGRRRAHPDGIPFSIKCLGVFDTVGSLGLPKELCLTRKARELFRFPDNLLGAHVEHCFHALALDETRMDFDVTLFEQQPELVSRGQLLRQVWFAGSHSDIGGGRKDHDLSDISLIWMASRIQELLSLDLEYLPHIIKGPTASWGTLKPYNPRKGIYRLSYPNQRSLPHPKEDEKNEKRQFIHPSVKKQEVLRDEVTKLLEPNSGFVWESASLEEKMREMWKPEPKNKKPRRLQRLLASVMKPFRVSIDYPEERKTPVRFRTKWFSAFFSQRVPG